MMMLNCPFYEHVFTFIQVFRIYMYTHTYACTHMELFKDSYFIWLKKSRIAIEVVKFPFSL